MRTLVVSTKETNRRSLHHMAKRTRHCTDLTAGAPSEVYGLLQHNWFDLILVDWSGEADLDVIRYLRSNWIYSRTPILVASESNMPDDVLQAVDAGADVFLVKPITPQKLARRIDRLIHMYAAPEEERPNRDLDAVVALMAEDAGDEDEVLV